MLALDSAGRRESERYTEWSRQASVKLARAGVTIGTGSDIWQIPIGVHLEPERWWPRGSRRWRRSTPRPAPPPASSAPSGLRHKIEPGKWADLVILDADPTADIRNTRRIRAVMQAGRLLDRRR
jgi:hypothetical protein